MSWEIIINYKARLNEAILYTFTGQFTRAAEVLNTEWALFYGVIFGFAIFDSYRLGVELNILSRLEKGQPRHHYQLVHMSAYSFNYLDRGNPWAAIAWSALFTGFGHLYNNKALKSVILVAWMVFIIHFSHLNSAIIATFNGNFPLAREVVDYQWLLFFPSIYVYAMWDAYNDTVEKNKLFAEAQKDYLKRKAQSTGSVRK